MKKVIMLVFAILAFALISCNSVETKNDSTTVKIDSVKTKADSVKAKVDTTSKINPKKLIIKK